MHPDLLALVEQSERVGFSLNLLQLVEKAEREGKWLKVKMDATYYTPEEVRAGAFKILSWHFVKLISPHEIEATLRANMEEARAALQLHQELLAGKNRFAPEPPCCAVCGVSDPVMYRPRSDPDWRQKVQCFMHTDVEVVPFTRAEWDDL